MINVTKENDETPKTTAAESLSEPEGAGGAPPAADALEAPQGTLGIVLIYLAVTAGLWFYVYFILLRSEGF